MKGRREKRREELQEEEIEWTAPSRCLLLTVRFRYLLSFFLSFRSHSVHLNRVISLPPPKTTSDAVGDNRQERERRPRFMKM